MSAVAELDPISQQKTDAQRFFETLWPDELPGKLILWTLPDKKTRVFNNVTDAAQAASELSKKHDVYYGCGLQAEAPKKGRGTAAGVCAIPGLWLDVDVSGSGHKAKDYFSTKDEAFAFLNGLPLKPSMMVWSGGGYHAYWLFNEPLQDTQRAAALSERWQRYVCSQTDKDVDSTHDLSRVLRVPGSFNHKNGECRPVEIMEISDERFDPADFEKFAVEVPDTKSTPSIPRIALDPENVAENSIRKDIIYDFKNAQPPAEKFAALIEIEPKFQQSWKRTRTGLKDSTASSYDMSLASFAAHAGWTDQEIVNLIIAHRCKFDDMGKLIKRTHAQVEDYFFNPSYGCVKKAMNDVAASPETLKALITSIYEAEPGSDERARLTPQLFLHLTKALGLPIKQILKTSRDITAQYIITLDGSEQIIIKNITDFRNQKVWLDHASNYAINAGSAPPVAKNKEEWFAVLQALSLAVTLAIDPEANEISETLAWVRTMTEFAPNYRYLRKGECEETSCFFSKDLLWIRVDGLIKSIAMHGGGRFKRNTMISRLKVAGFERKEFTFHLKDGIRKTRSFFVADHKKMVFDDD